MHEEKKPQEITGSKSHQNSNIKGTQVRGKCLSGKNSNLDSRSEPKLRVLDLNPKSSSQWMLDRSERQQCWEAVSYLQFAGDREKIP
jgi:hypothetical protein